MNRFFRFLLVVLVVFGTMEAAYAVLGVPHDWRYTLTFTVWIGSCQSISEIQNKTSRIIAYLVSSFTMFVLTGLILSAQIHWLRIAVGTCVLVALLEPLYQRKFFGRPSGATPSTPNPPTNSDTPK